MANKNLTGQSIAESYQQMLIVNAEAGVEGQTTVATQIMGATASAAGGVGVNLTTPLFVSRDRLGIGTATPGQLLEVNGGGAATKISVLTTGDNSPYLHLRSYSDANYAGINMYVEWISNSVGKLHITRPNGNEGNIGMTMDVNGKIGILTETPGSPLDIKQSADTHEGGIRLTKTSSTAYTALFQGSAGETGSQTEDFTIFNSYLSGNMLTIQRDGGVFLCAYDAISDLRTDAAGQLYDGSDERLKKDIVTIDKALEKVCGLRGVYYKWKTREEGNTYMQGGDEKQIGLIAQEVATVVPELAYAHSKDREGVPFADGIWTVKRLSLIHI